MSRTGMFIWSGTAAIVSVALLSMTMKSEEVTVNLNELTPEEEQVIVRKGTEPPFSGKYYEHNENGTYTCKRCDAQLYKSTDKFNSGCGWPSFDDEIPGAVIHSVDADGVRTEITCAKCTAHLGHVFEGERLTSKNVRHCVNSISLDFVSAQQKVQTEKAFFAGGCFWGTEYLLQKADGVISTRVGYMGGHTENPTYREICEGTTGHAEAIEVEFDPAETDFETLSRLFFEIHDPTQVDRQGPDVGDQYRSAVFYDNDNQRQVVEKLVLLLKDRGFDVVTQIAEAGTFWEAEQNHQDYYDTSGKQPYCHTYQKRF